jgi:hypothetical protein
VTDSQAFHARARELAGTRACSRDAGPPPDDQASVCCGTDLAALIRRAPARCGQIGLVAIGGPGGAGKSVFAERLARTLGGVQVVRTDNFAS